MEAGNLPSKETIEMDYLRCPIPQFRKSEFEKTLIFRPHHKKSIDGKGVDYHPIITRGHVQEVDCCCVVDDVSKVVNSFRSSTYPTLLWVDPERIPTECLAGFISAWRDILNADDNVALAIVVHKGSTSQKVNGLFEPWRIEGLNLSYSNVVNEPIWYPSLARNVQSLRDAAAYLNPYDVFPLVEFSDWSVEWGEVTIASHYSILEQFRTRTRNLIYIDMTHPENAFSQLYGTLKALRRSGSSVFQPVITPGGNVTTFLTTLFSGVLADAYFLTPKEEIPINNGTDAEGVMILRKCI